jgi:glycosyltransferase involved in cell wall biosynthesis
VAVIFLMIKILRIINRFNVGGISYNVAYLSKHMPEEYVTKIIGGKEDISEKNSGYIFENLELKYTIIPSMRRPINFYNDIKALIQLKKVIVQFKPDIIHTHASKAGLIGRLAGLLSYRKSIYVHTYHGNVFDGYYTGFTRKLIIYIEKILSFFTTAIIAISESQRVDLVKKYKIGTLDKVHVIPLGFNLDKFINNSELNRWSFRDRYLIPENCIVLTIVGRLVPIKNHQLFLNVISELKNILNQPVLGIIVGDGESRTYIEDFCLKNKLSISNDKYSASVDILMTSWLTDLENVYAGSDFVLLTSRNEGTPVSIIEAMASGKVILSTNVGGIADFVDSSCGVLCSFTPKDFISNILSLLNDENLRSSISSNARKRVSSTFSYLRLCNDTDLLYKKMLKIK